MFYSVFCVSLRIIEELLPALITLLFLMIIIQLSFAQPALNKKAQLTQREARDSLGI